MSGGKAPFDWEMLPDGTLLLVDTAPLIYHLANNEQHARRFFGLFEQAAAGRLRIALTTITLTEVLTGPFARGRDSLAARIEAALYEFEVYPLDRSIAVQAARLRARYRLRLPDAIQLATALAIQARALVTHDRGFSAVEDIPIIR